MLTWNTMYDVSNTESPGVASAQWEVRWRLGDEAYSVDDWHKSSGAVNSVASDGALIPSAGTIADNAGTVRDISFAARDLVDADTNDSDTRYSMTAVVGLTTSDAGIFVDGAGNLRNFTEYEFQVRDGTDPDDQTRVWTIARTPAAPPDEVDDLDADPGIREVTLSWDEAASDNMVTAWQIFSYTAAEAEDRNIMNADLSTGQNQDEIKESMDDMPALSWHNISNSDDDTSGYTVEGLNSGTEYTFWVRAVSYDTRGEVDTEEDSFEVVDAEDMTPATPVVTATDVTMDEEAEKDEGMVTFVLGGSHRG